MKKSKSPKNPKSPRDSRIIPWSPDLPTYDHIVIVVEENKDWADIIGNPDAPYINQLADEGALFTQSFGCEHHSQGNYFWLFSGSNQNVGFMDEVPPVGSIDAMNLATSLYLAGRSFKGYSQSLPEVGSTVDDTPYPDQPNRKLYARKHVPWVSFDNIPYVTDPDPNKSCHLRFADFPSDFNDLPTVSFVIPDLENDMHNLHEDVVGCTNKGSVCVGDRWLKRHLDDYYQWAKHNNSLLIVTFDEDNGMGYAGLTDPFADLPDGVDCKQVHTHVDVAHPEPGSGEDPSIEATPCGMRNGIVTIFAGAHIIPGEYDEGAGITHVNVLRTIEAMYGLPKAGAQQENAAAGGISDNYVIRDVFARK